MTASLLSYGNIAIKLAVGLIGFLWALRTTNRCQLAQMTPVDLIGNFVMGGIIGGVIYTQDITTVQFIIVLAIWQLLVLGVNALRIHTQSRSEDDSGKAYSCCDKRQVFDRINLNSWVLISLILRHYPESRAFTPSMIYGMRRLSRMGRPPFRKKMPAKHQIYS